VRKRIVSGVELREIFPSGGTEASPVVVAIHGRGDHPANWVADWSRFPRAAHVLLPCGFIPFGEGFSWFDLSREMTDDQVAASLGAAETKLWPAIAAVAGTRPLLVTGFSQGGMLSFAIAARHGDRVMRAFPVAGTCPPSLFPAPGTKVAPVVALHGTSDALIPFAKGKATVEALHKAGHEASMIPYPDVGHTITGEMHTRLWQELTRAMAA
jgi:phospholipase/carboxylesterase